jgi:hypothetical protein
LPSLASGALRFRSSAGRKEIGVRSLDMAPPVGNFNATIT